MKRDIDLIREILLQLELNGPNMSGVKFQIEGYSQDEINYHLSLLVEGGLVDAIDVSSHKGVGWIPRRLTLEGHDFLDRARDKNRWEKAKKILAEKGGGMAIGLLNSILINLIKNEMG